MNTWKTKGEERRERSEERGAWREERRVKREERRMRSGNPVFVTQDSNLAHLNILNNGMLSYNFIHLPIH